MRKKKKKFKMINFGNKNMRKICNSSKNLFKNIDINKTLIQYFNCLFDKFYLI